MPSPLLVQMVDEGKLNESPTRLLHLLRWVVGELSGQTYLVTGASKGIGRSISLNWPTTVLK